MWVPRNRYAHALATAPLVVVLQTTRYWSDTQWRKKRGNVINGTAESVPRMWIVNSLGPGWDVGVILTVWFASALSLFGYIRCEIALKWMPQNLAIDGLTLAQVKALCQQATCHNLRQCWPRLVMPYIVTAPQVDSPSHPTPLVQNGDQFGRGHFQINFIERQWENFKLY